jgi:predicted transcriptional regulator
MPNPDRNTIHDLHHLTADVVSAYVGNNNVQARDLPDLIAAIHSTLSGLGEAKQPEPEKLVAPMSARKAVQQEYIISFEDGRHYKSLKRHLAGRGLTPQQYRAKWGLPGDFPMTAPGYSARRSELAKTSGLGRQRQKETPEPAPKRQPRAKKAAPAPEAGG